MKIIIFEDKYYDQLVKLVLEAKQAIGRKPRLNEDLYDIKTNYFDKGHPFWIAINENDEVIGCIGTKSDDEGNLFLSHLFVRYDLKRQGIGSKLLEVAENSAILRGYNEIHTHLGKDYLESHIFYPRKGYIEYKDSYMKKTLTK